MKDKLLHWFATGQRGASSEAMACHFAGIPNGTSHPCDPADFNRCLLLLEAVPEARELLPSMADVSPTWARMVERWGEIEYCFRDEVGLNWEKGRNLHASRTFDLMQDVRRGEY